NGGRGGRGEGRRRRRERPKPQRGRKRGQRLSRLKKSAWLPLKQNRSAKRKPQPRRKRSARVRRPSDSGSPLSGRRRSGANKLKQRRERATLPWWAKATQISTTMIMIGLSRPSARRFNSILRKLSPSPNGASLMGKKATTSE